MYAGVYDDTSRSVTSSKSVWLEYCTILGHWVNITHTSRSSVHVERKQNENINILRTIIKLFFLNNQPDALIIQIYSVI
jgi:hypothetical protein